MPLMSRPLKYKEERTTMYARGVNAGVDGGEDERICGEGAKYDRTSCERYLNLDIPAEGEEIGCDGGAKMIGDEDSLDGTGFGVGDRKFRGTLEELERFSRRAS